MSKSRRAGQDARPYHHGDLRRALLDAAIEAITEAGPATVSLRDLARRAGVSHAAPAYHFGDKAGLLTAIAADGFRLLGAALGEAWTATGSFLEVGVAYVGFAVTHRAHFEVMFRPELYRPDDPEVSRARGASARSEEHTSELQSHHDLVCRLLLEKKKKKKKQKIKKKKKKTKTKNKHKK